MKNRPEPPVADAERASARPRRRPGSTWLVIVLVLNVCIGMAYSILTLRQKGDGFRGAEVVLTGMEGDIQLQEALRAQVQASRKAGLVMADQTRGAARQLANGCAELARLKGADEILPMVCPASSGLQIALEKEAELLERGDILSARQVSDDEVAPRLTELRNSLKEAVTVARAEARDASVVADTESIVMMLFAAMMTALLFRRFERERVSGDLKAARERAHGEVRFRSLVQSSSDVITIIDKEGVIQYLSPSVEHVLGHSPDGVKGASLESLLHPDDAQRVLADMRELVDGHDGMEVVFDCRWAHQDGSWRQVECISTNLLKEPHIGGIVINTRDITDRKQAEDALRDSERRYRSLIEAATDVVLTVSVDGRFTSLNPAFDELTGSLGREWIGREIKDLIHPEDSSVIAQMLQDVLDGQRPKACTVRFGLLTDDFVTVELAAAPQVEGDSVTGALVIARDVTEQRRLQDQLRQAQKMEAVGQLAGGIAHDFNNLLAVIQNCAAFILEDLDDSDQSKSDAEEISKAAERAAVLTKQLLAFSRREIVRPEVLDLAEVVAGMEKMLRRMVMESIGLTVKSTPTSWRAKIDPGQLEQVILNLVVNASDAMPNGGTLTIVTVEAEIDEAFSRQHQGLTPGEYVRLSVIDTGHGMSGDIVARAFEPFYTTKPRGSGTGLGLATVYGIVKAAGGHISVHSEVGLGTTIDVYLPMTEVAVTDSVSSESVRSQSGCGERILVVEDEPGLRRLVRRILTQNGYEVLVAASGDEAIDMVRGLTGDLALLLTDVVMPRISGGELAETLCRARPDLKAIYMSGYPDETVVLHGALKKGQGYVQKPFSADDLLRAVREVLDGASVV